MVGATTAFVGVTIDKKPVVPTIQFQAEIVNAPLDGPINTNFTVDKEMDLVSTAINRATNQGEYAIKDVKRDSKSRSCQKSAYIDTTDVEDVMVIYLNEIIITCGCDTPNNAGVPIPKIECEKNRVNLEINRPSIAVVKKKPNFFQRVFGTHS
jgi:hypothetical protein